MYPLVILDSIVDISTVSFKKGIDLANQLNYRMVSYTGSVYSVSAAFSALVRNNNLTENDLKDHSFLFYLKDLNPV